MNKLVVLFLTAIIAFTFTSCWSATVKNANTETGTTIVNSDTNASSNIQTNIDVNVVNETSANAGDISNSPLLNVQSNKVGNHIKSGEMGVDSKDMKNAEKNRIYQTAPENSRIWGEMNKDGNPVQIREFADNPLIKKIEIITISATEKKQLLYLKNGKVLDIEPGKVDDPMYASSFSLLKAVGIETKTDPQNAGGSKKGKQ